MDIALRLLARVPVGPLVAVVAIVGLWVLSNEPHAADRVPQLEGLPVNTAIERATADGYFTKVVWKRSGGIAGTVVDQEPEHRSVRKRGTRIVLTVTRGAAQVRVPDVRGVDVEEARRRLDRGHLTPGAVTYKEKATYRPDRVITTDPPAGGLVDVGTTVDIVAAV